MWVVTSNNEEELNDWAEIIIRLKELGASNRSIAKFLGWSEPTFRRMWNSAIGRTASNDADGGENPNGSNGARASNDASPALKAVLKNLPKLTANEREVVRMQLDILALASPDGSTPTPQSAWIATARRRRGILRAKLDQDQWNPAPKQLPPYTPA
jgi:DNA-binding CsgD family transcriptional regulator